MADRSTSKVFISYVHANKRLVRRLVHCLTTAGVDVWWDEEGLRAGAKWKRDIREAIQQGTFFIACFSEQYWRRNSCEADGTYMNEELLTAVDRLRKLPLQRDWFIPVCLNRCAIPRYDIGADMSLPDLQAVHIWRDWTVGIQQILRAVIPHGPMPPELRAELLRLTSESPDARRDATEALGRLRDVRAVPHLIDALRDSDSSVRLRSLWALLSIGEPIAVPSMVALLGEPPGKGPEADAAVIALGRMGSDLAIDPLLRVARGRGVRRYTRTQAVQALVGLGCVEVIPMLKRIISNSAEDRWSRQSAAVGIMSLDGDNGVPYLVSVLRRTDPIARWAAVCALAKCSCGEARNALVPALKDQDERVRAAAVEGLGKRSTRLVMAHLLPAIDDAAPAVRTAAITALSKLRDDGVAAAIAARADDPEAEVRLAVARALGRLKHIAGVQVLTPMLWDDGLSPGETADHLTSFVARDIRLAAASALGKIGDPAGMRAVDEAERDRAFVLAIEL